MVYATGGGIAIPTFDRKCIVMCHSVKYAPELWVAKGQPKYVLFGIDRVGFWGEHLNTLGWYATLDDVKKEMEAITGAIKNGQASVSSPARRLGCGEVLMLAYAAFCVRRTDCRVSKVSLNFTQDSRLSYYFVRLSATLKQDV